MSPTEHPADHPSPHHAPRRSSSPRARACLLILGAAASLLLTACSKPEPAAQNPRPIVAQPVQAEPLAHAWTLPATVQARDSTPLSFRVSGKLIERLVRPGDTVRQGQLLARLDPQDTARNAAAARALLDAATHQLDFARQQFERDQAQHKEDLIATNQWEQSKNAYAAALAQRDQTREQSALSDSQQQYTFLHADRAGVITAESADTGQNISAGQAVYQLAWSGAMDVLVDIPENIQGQLAPGQSASLELPALPGRRWEARLRELAPAADPQSRAFRAKFALGKPTPDLRIGMTARVTFGQAATTGDMGYTLPATALFHDGNFPAVWVVEPANHTLALRRVSVARYGPRSITVGTGLKQGDVVVWQGVHTVSAEQEVKPIAPLHPEDFSL